jgi:adenine phosphoribosyltransferase
MNEAELKQHIRDIPDFPQPGVIFKDITPLLAHEGAFRDVVGAMADRYADAGVTQVAGIEARGFIFAAPLAYALGAGFVPVRKAGKLPHEVEQEDYELEYGSDLLEVHRDAVHAGDRVLIVDDVLATGGTAAAVGRLMRRFDAEVIGMAVLVELLFLGGRAKLPGIDLFSLVRYDG